MLIKYMVSGEPFRFRCDASEWSYQLASQWAREDEEGRDSLEVRQVDNDSYGVFDKLSGRLLISFPVDKQ